MSLAYDIVCSADDRDIWLAARSKGVGASEIAAVCGQSKWDSPYSIWARKRGLLPEKDESESMVWGKLLEPIILSEYARRTGRAARRHAQLIRSKQYPWALASLDGETWLFDAANEVWPLELKTASAYSAEDWAEGPPPAYVLQVQQQMLVAGASKATSACLLGGQQMVWCDVERDEILINRIIAKGSDLWARVERGEPPAVDGHDATLAALSYGFPKDDGRSILLPFDMLDLADQFDAAKERGKGVALEVAELEARIKVALGPYSRGMLPDGRGWSWTHQERAAYTVPAGESRVLRRIKPKKNRKAA